MLSCHQSVPIDGHDNPGLSCRWHEGKIPFSWMGDSTHCLGHMFPHTQFEEEQLATEGEQGEQGEGDGEEEGDDEDGAGRRLLQDAGGVQVVDDVAIYATPDNARWDPQSSACLGTGAADSALLRLTGQV